MERVGMSSYSWKAIRAIYCSLQLGAVVALDGGLVSLVK
jgi:hypothetical protein